MPFKATVNSLFNGVWCYLVIAFFWMKNWRLLCPERDILKDNLDNTDLYDVLILSSNCAVYAKDFQYI